MQAEYGIRKTSLLAFSEEKQFDPLIAHARFAELHKLAPAGIDAKEDPHIRYAQALFLWQTDNSPENTEAVKSLLQAMDPEVKKHSAALALLGEIALQQDDLELAIASFNKALKISPHHWSAINNLAYAYQQRAGQYFAQGDAKKGLNSLVQQAYPRYQESARLDAELITPNIELKRLKALLKLSSGQVNLQVANLIAQIETDQLQLMAKNKDEIFYQWLDKQGKTQEAAISSWEAKKAYLLQLQWLVNYFQTAIGRLNKQSIKAQLAKIQNTSIDGKLNLPRFLYNDLSILKNYHPEWIGQADIEQKYVLLLSIVQQ